MTREELINRAEQLAKEALAANEEEAAAILYALCGALHVRSERQLMEVCARHATADLRRLTASLN
jgi:hypothetical protein